MKLKLIGVSNAEDYVIFSFLYNKEYYNFLLDLLKFFNIDPLPDLFKNGKIIIPNVINEEHYMTEDEDIKTITFEGSKKIKLLVKTSQRDKLMKFIENNAIFISFKKNKKKL